MEFDDDEIYTLKDIAAHLGISYGTAKSHLHRERKIPPPDRRKDGRLLWFGRTINDYLRRPGISVTIDVSPDAVRRWSEIHGTSAHETSVRAAIRRELRSLLSRSQLGTFDIDIR